MRNSVRRLTPTWIAGLFAALSLIAPAVGQTSYPDPSGNQIPAGVVSTLNVSGKAVPASSTNPLPVSGSFSATLAGFAPGGSFASLNVLNASSARVALPTGATVVVYNTGSNIASVNLGNTSVTATALNDQIWPQCWMAFSVGSNVDLAAFGIGGTTTLVISGGTGLPTGGCASSGGAANASVGATGSAVPGSATYGGMNVAGNLTGMTGTSHGLSVDASGATIAAQGTGTAGTPAGNLLTVQGVTGMTPVATNTSQINGTTGLAGAGATGAGSQRVTAAQDTTTIAGSAPGTAGTPSANVVTVQGAASMTPLATNQTQVNGATLSATNPLLMQPTDGTAVNSATHPLFNTAKVWDGTNTATVKAASTAAGAGDTSVVVALSPNTTLPGFAANPTMKIDQTTPASTNAVAQMVNVGNAQVQQHVCGSFKSVHITSATDTQILAANGSNNIYICDFEFSNGAAAENFFFEKSSTGTCGATLTQIGTLWTLIANQAKAASNAFYRGFSTGASQQLCVNTSTAGPIDIGVYYDQY